MFKYTTTTLKKIENIYTEGEFQIRYERGSFKAGYCILEDKKVVVVNKFFSLEAKINCLIDILPRIEIEKELLSEKSRELLKGMMKAMPTEPAPQEHAPKEHASVPD